MGISYPAVNINPGYMPPGPPAQPWLLQALLGAAEAFQRAQELKLARGQQASIASRENARIGLEAQRLSFETRQAADARAQLEALGRAYPQLIAALAGNGQTPTPQAASLPGVFDPRALLGVPQLTQQMPQTPVFNIPTVPQSAPAGMLVPGNIDVTNRPRVQNPDGTISTVRSMSFGENGREILVPTISPDGRLLSNQQAIDLYHQTGQHLGVFQDPASATLYAQQLHNAQAAALAGNGNGMVSYPSSGMLAPPPNPFAALNSVLQGIPAAVVPDFVRTAAPLVQLAATKQSEAAELQRLEAAVQRAYPKDPAKQEGFRAAVTIAKAGVGNLNPEMLQQALGLDANGGVDPQKLNAAVNLWQTGVPTWRQVRSTLGLPKSLVPDDAVYPGPPGQKNAGLTADQGRIASLLPTMLEQTQAINGLVDGGVRVGFKGSLLQGIEKPGVFQGIVNSIQNPQERQLIDASLSWGQGWVFAISGAATNRREVFSTLQSVLPVQGDDNATLAKKRGIMDAMNRGVMLRAGGHIPNTASALVTQVLTDPNLPPEARALFLRQRGIAAQYDKAVTEGRAPIAAPDAPAQNVPDAVSTFGSLIDQLPDSALGMGRASATVPPGAVTGTGIGMALDAYRKQHQTTPPRTSP